MRRFLLACAILGISAAAWADPQDIDTQDNAGRLVDQGRPGPTAWPVTGSFSFAPSTTPTTILFSGTQPVTVVNFPTSTYVSNFPSSFDISNFPLVQQVSGTVTVGNFPSSLSVTQGVSPWVVSGSVAVSNFPSTFTVVNFPTSTAVSNFPADQLVHFASSQPVTVGNFPAIQTISGTISVSNFPSTQPVSGSVSVDNFPSSTTAYQGTIPWTISGPVSQAGVWGTSSTIVNFPSFFGAAQSGVWGASVTVTNFPSSVTAFQGTSPWITSGTVSVLNFPAVQPVSQSGIWGTSTTVVNFSQTQPASQAGIWGTTTTVTNFPSSTTAFQGGAPWTVQVVSTGTALPLPRVRAQEERWFSVTTDTRTVATANETDFFYFVMPGTETVSVFLSKMRLGCQTTISNWKVYRGPVVTSSGTALSIFPGMASSSSQSKAKAFYSPTVTSRGTPVFLSMCNENIREELLDQSRIVTPGRSFLVTVDNVGTGNLNSVDMEWSEEVSP